MVGEQYFEMRQGKKFEYSILRYLCGTGRLGSPNWAKEVDWEINVDVTGRCLLILSNQNFTEAFNLLDYEENLLVFKGYSQDDLWLTSCNKLRISHIETNLELGEPLDIVTGIPQQIIINRIDSPLEITDIKGFINNFKFLGLETSQYGRCYVRDKFTINVQNRNIVFRQLKKHKEILELIETKQVSNAVLSTMKFPVIESIEDSRKLVNDICYFLCFVNINSNYCPVIYYLHDEEPVKIEIGDTITSPFHGNIVIDNHHIFGGLQQIFNGCFEQFQKLDEEINMKLFISNLLGMYEGKYLENKIANLLLSYEYLMTKLLIARNNILTQQQVANLNFQQKLARVNGLLRFIPRALLGDTLRTDVRNPLFHQGEIPFLDFNSKLTVFTEYFDLLMQIVFILIGYSGDYISRIDYKVRQVPRSDYSSRG